MESRERRAREIQEAIRLVLLRDWDPISVRDAAQAQDEYDGYVGGVSQLLASGATLPELAEHLLQIERDSMRLTPRPDVLVEVASRLRQIDISLDRPPNTPLQQPKPRDIL
jgi:hypothetical protein